MVWHRSLARDRMVEFVTNLNMIVWLLNVVGIVVISLSVGLLNVIFFMQRANEFGLLAALGYTKRFLVRPTFLEAAFTVATGWVLGILFLSGDLLGDKCSPLRSPRPRATFYPHAPRPPVHGSRAHHRDALQRRHCDVAAVAHGRGRHHRAARLSLAELGLSPFEGGQATASTQTAWLGSYR